MRFTIERIRTLILAAGVLLVVALGIFLAIGRFKSPFSRRDIPKRLGIDIEQEANGVTYTQAHGGHTLFKIHASKVVQLKNDHALLHNVQIELYGADGSRVDRIDGDEFEYDQKAGTAIAAGPVEITLMRPGVAPAVAAKASPQQTAKNQNSANPTAPGSATAANGEIHVNTSGLAFDEKSGVLTTAQRVDFSMAQGSGSSIGASYDSQQGFLVLDRDVELTASAAAGARSPGPVKIRAGHAEFYRDTNLCLLRTAEAGYRGGHAAAANAQILFRDDGTAVRLEASGGFMLASASGGHLSAPTGALDFDEHNQPRHAHLEGGVLMESVSGARTMQAGAPVMELEFAPRGELRHAHLERGVEMRSDEASQAMANGQSIPVRVSRTWRSPVADVEFRLPQRSGLGHSMGQGKIEPASMHGSGGVVIAGLNQRGNAKPFPSKLAADEVTGEFGPDSALRAMTGAGHASVEQTTATGANDTASGDRLEAHFAPAGAAAEQSAKSGVRNAGATGEMAAAQVQSAALDGHVVLIQQPAAKPGTVPQPEMRATAGHAAYEGAGEWLHLSESPRVEDGGLELAADQIDVSQESGDAWAHGSVKGTWMNAAAGGVGAAGSKPGEDRVAFGGQGPAHVIAAEAQLHRATGEATFRGNARLWQQVNSVAAPVIVLNRQKQTLVARSTDAAHPVIAVLVSASGLGGRQADGRQQSSAGGGGGNPAASSVIRVRGGELWYSNVERKAVMQGGILGAVTAETGAATSVSSNVELQLTPLEARAGAPAPNSQGQVERMTATGHVVVSSQGRRGTGNQLVYTGADGTYRLTGTAAAPPRMTDPQRGSVTGEALIFNSRDDSVSIEGGAQETRTETTAPK